MIGGDTALIQGIQGAFWNTLRGLHRYWDRIDIICPYVSRPKTLTVFGNVFLHPLPRGKLISPFYVLREGMKAVQKDDQPLLTIHSYGMQLTAWGAYWLARKFNLPFVVEVHHVDGFPKSDGFVDICRRLMTFFFLRVVHRRASAIRIANRAELVPLLLSLGIPEQKLKVLYAVYLDQTVFRPLPNVIKQYDVVFIGRLVPNKGLPLLIRAFHCLKQRLPKSRLLIVGRGPLESWLKRRLKVEDGIEYIPFLSSAEEIAEAYNKAKAVVCASSAEGGPRFVVEAMACGLPAVSTPIGLMREIIRNGETGFLVQSWLPQEMADRIADLLESEDLYRRCSKGAIEVTRQFDRNHTISQCALAYRKLLEA